MVNYKLTDEAKKVFDYIKNDLVKMYPTRRITIEYFLLAILENDDSFANKILSKIMLSDTIAVLHEHLIRTLSSQNPPALGDRVFFDSQYDTYIQKIRAKKGVNESVNTGDILIAIIESNTSIATLFKTIGVSVVQMQNGDFPPMDSNLPAVVEVSENKPSVINKPNTSKKFSESGEVAKQLTNICKLASEGKVDEVIGNENVFEQIFQTLAKKRQNNVVIVGDSGIGKTATVKHIAHLLNNDNVPKPFRGKQLMEINFTSLLAGTSFKGMFEAKWKMIVDDAKKKGCYIFFIDDIHSILSENSKLAEVNTESLLDEILADNTIPCICTTSHKAYNHYISRQPLLKRRFQKIVMNEPTDEEVGKIVAYHAERLGNYHNVTYSADALRDCCLLSRRYITEHKLPDSAINILDEAGAKLKLCRVEGGDITSLRNKLSEVVEKKNEFNTNPHDYKQYDELFKQEIAIKSQIAQLEKQETLSEQTLEVNDKLIREVVAKKTGVDVTEVTTTEKQKLQTLNSNILSQVIGQDEAVDEICRVVKRQRIGVANPNKPAVLFFAGSTGTGKTYLAKCLAKEVFGSEKHMIRLDMSEYVDKMSVNKLYGASAGYVGYDNGGILTEAIKKHKHCVLLLDEIEKANDDVHNVFLQLFDEGKLTDNTGEVVDFKNVIIIMTSNIGAKEAADRGRNIGFINQTDFTTDIINKELKSKFKPEFLNRIDSIVYFNTLTEDNMKTIIRLELKKLSQRIELLGYSLDESITNTIVPEVIYKQVVKDLSYGARPVAREIQKRVEDKIVDYIIDNDPPKGFMFNSQILNIEPTV